MADGPGMPWPIISTGGGGRDGDPNAPAATSERERLERERQKASVLAKRLVDRRQCEAELAAVREAVLTGANVLPPLIKASVFGFAGMSFISGLWATALQQLVPSRALARISSYDNLVSYAILPIGLALSGPVSAAVGLRPALGVAAAAMVIPSAIIAVLPSVRRVERGSDGLFTGAEVGPSSEASNGR
jgi:hypothetical protein